MSTQCFLMESMQFSKRFPRSPSREMGKLGEKSSLEGVELSDIHGPSPGCWEVAAKDQLICLDLQRDSAIVRPALITPTLQLKHCECVCSTTNGHAQYLQTACEVCSSRASAAQREPFAAGLKVFWWSVASLTGSFRAAELLLLNFYLLKKIWEKTSSSDCVKYCT